MIALARRLGATALSVPAARSAVIRAGDLQIDSSTRQVRFGDDEVTLTPREFDLLVYLASAPGQVHSGQQLMQDVWLAHTAQTSSTLTVHVRSLRTELRHVCGDHHFLRTIRSIGYAFDAPPPRRHG